MFKKLFICLALALPVFGSQLQSKRYFSNNGGLVDHISPILIPSNSAKAVTNISMDDRGDLIKRNGFTIIQSTTALGPSTKNVLGGGYHKAASGSDFFAVVVGSDIYRIGNTYTTYSKITGSVVFSSVTTNLAQKTDFNDTAIFCNEVDTPAYVASSGNATVLSTNTFGNAKTCTTYGNYFVVGNTIEAGTSYPTRIRWSDINNQNSFPVLNYIDVELSDGDKIVSIVAFDESVYIFKQRSIYQMLITGLSGPDAFIIRPVSRNIGAWAKNSVQVIPSVGIAFLAQNTAYLLSDNGLSPIGDPIQRTFDTIQRSQWANTVAGVYPKKYQYWLAVSTAGTTNSEVLVYDYVQKNWTTYDDMSLSMMSQAQNSTGDNILLTGGYTGVTWQQDNGTVDQIASVTGSSITASYTTGDLFSDSLDLTKNFKYLYLVTTGDHNYNLTVNTAYDLSNAYEGTQTFSVGSITSVYDTAVYDTDIYASGNNTVSRIELNRSAKTVRLQFQQSDTQGSFGVIGWTLVFSVEDYRQ
jgi:hypothetical protein